jgi:zinc protease
MRIQNHRGGPIALLVTLACVAPGAIRSDDGSGAAAVPQIPYVKYVLDNGLTLIVHKDRKAPIVAVNVWYHVGSKNERPGKTGFAHLFEHLMFNGTEHYNDDYFAPFDRIGATDMNGTTGPDRTNYFQNVPTSGLDTALWMESDRMGHLLGAIDQAKLDEQRGVVQNEKRQRENHPYGQVFRLLVENSYPAGHPYSWPVIGSMEDLDAADLEDVRTWFETYYGAANAVIAVAGDVDAEAVKARVEHYFGDIPSGPPVTRHATWVAWEASMPSFMNTIIVRNGTIPAAPRAGWPRP